MFLFMLHILYSPQIRRHLFSVSIRQQSHDTKHNSMSNYADRPINIFVSSYNMLKRKMWIIKRCIILLEIMYSLCHHIIIIGYSLTEAVVYLNIVFRRLKIGNSLFSPSIFVFSTSLYEFKKIRIYKTMILPVVL